MDVAGSSEYRNHIVNATSGHRLQLSLSKDGVASISASNFGSVSTATLIFVVARHRGEPGP